MTLETFFEKFDQVADAPDAVAKMRELVLELAVQGKLVGQDPKDDSADELLRQIELTRSRTGKTANGRKLERLPPIEPDDSPFEIPHGWAWCPLGNLGLIGSSCRVHEKDWTTTGVPFLRAREIVKLAKAGTVNNDLFITEEHYRRLAGEGLIPEPDDIMITGVGTIGVPYIVRDADRFYFKDASVLILKNCFHLYPHYLHLVMQSPYWVREVHKESMGTTVHTLTIVRAKQTPIPLPPLGEQKRIVAGVDELMALCDRLEVQQKERETRHAALVHASLARFADAPTPANLNFIFHKSFDIPPADLRKSILTLAVQGKLVPQDPNDEPAAELISQIAEEKRRLVSARIIRDKDEAAPITDGEISFEVPYGWEWARLSSITRRIHYGYTASAKSDLKDVRLLRITDIQNNFVDWPSVPGCEIAKEDVDQYQLERGDILVARTGGTVGKTYLVQDVPVVAVFASYLIRIQGGTSVFDRYLKLFLESPTYWVQLEEGARGAAQPNVNGQTLGNMVVSVPPLAEQRRIVAKVEQLMALVDALETQLAASRATSANLLSALVAELTGTPNDSKVSVPSSSGTGRRGRPRKSA